MSVDPPQTDFDSDDDPIRRVPDETETTERPPSDPPVQSTETLKDSVAPGRIPKEIGRYHIKRVIASGGMGTVYEAVQEHPRRTVAVKVMKHGIASRSAMRRFEYESQILARLRHPGIAQVYEAGTHQIEPSCDREGTELPGTVPFFAMEYIPNAKPITQYAKEKKLGTRERLDLFGKVCDAVHHGHQKGIIHRDLKPSNILVDSQGQPRVIDFGVARATDSDLAVTTLQTDVGQLIGTMQYMSPEQCEADPHDLDIRSDVYALGVVLYELLCQKLPYDVSKVAVYEATRMVREHQPTRLSTIDRTLRGDIETIVFKALEKERDRRYRSAAELADDIGRYLTGEAIIARPPSIVYQIHVFARRNKAFFSAVSAAFVVLVAGVVVSTSLYVQADRQRQRAVVAEQKQSRERQRAEAAQEAEATQRGLAEFERDKARRQTYVASIAAAATALSAGEVARARRYLEGAPAELRDWEWKYLQANADRSLTVLRGHGDTVNSAAYSPDGSRIASASRDKTVRLWNASTSMQQAVLHGHEGSVNSVSFSPDSTRLASASSDGTVRVWDTRAGGELAVLTGHEDGVNSVSFSPDGTKLASGSRDGTVRLWDALNGNELAVLPGHKGVVRFVTFTPDGARLASAGDKDPESRDYATHTTVRLWDVSAGEQVTFMHAGEFVGSLAFNSDGSRLASASTIHAQGGLIRLWDTSTSGEELTQIRGHRGFVFGVDFSPDDSRLASAGLDETLRIWDAATGEELATFYGHEGRVTSVNFSPDGKRLVSTSSDGTVRIWDASGQKASTFAHADGGVWGYSIDFSPDGNRLATSGRGQFVDCVTRLWDASTFERLPVLEGYQARWSPDGTLLASVDPTDKAIRLWDSDNGEQMAVVNSDMTIGSIEFSPDGTVLASTSLDGKVSLWDLSSKKRIAVLQGHSHRVLGLAFSPDGGRLASASADKTVRLWDLASHEQSAVLRGHDDAVFCVAFNAEGTRLASGEVHDANIHVWDAHTGSRLTVLRGHQYFVSHLAFSPNGTRLASASRDRTVRIWEADTGTELIVLRGHNHYVGSLAFSPDGTRLASMAKDSTVRIWDTVPFRVRYRERQAIIAAQPKAERMAEQLWQRCNDWKIVAQRVREDTSLTEFVRRAALNEVLRRATAAREETIATPDEPEAQVSP